MSKIDTTRSLPDILKRARPYEAVDAIAVAGEDKPWHSPEFIADEETLVVGTSLLVASIMDYLGVVVK